MWPKQDLCEELFKLSGWEEDTFDWWGENKTYLAPRYSLGYLLRKLPDGISLQHYSELGEPWIIALHSDQANSLLFTGSADIPEDCAAKLAIVLFQQSILKRKGEK